MTARQLSDGNDDGQILGQSATDKVGFFGATPITRPVATVAGALTAGATTPADIAAGLCDLRDQLIATGLISGA